LAAQRLEQPHHSERGLAWQQTDLQPLRTGIVSSSGAHYCGERDQSNDQTRPEQAGHDISFGSNGES
jgi:hypothetical protein